MNLWRKHLDQPDQLDRIEQSALGDGALRLASRAAKHERQKYLCVARAHYSLAGRDGAVAFCDRFLAKIASARPISEAFELGGTDTPKPERR